MSAKKLVLLCWWALVLPVLAAEPLDVVYPQVEERPPGDYGYALLELALIKSGVPYRLRMSDAPMNQERARTELAGGRVSVIDFGAAPEFEQRFKAVYFPIDRGLSGYRLPIIHRAQAPQFARIRSLDDLRQRVAGQGPGWADARVLEAAGIRVVSAEFRQLFRMVDAQRFDFYPLGLEEAHGLLERHRSEAPNSIVEGTLALHYPFARLFFVNSADDRLHDALAAGLQKAFADGSFQSMLENNALVKASLARAAMARRTIIDIDNPLQTPAFRAIPREYFIRFVAEPAARAPVNPERRSGRP
ncbi:hypothetical protein [Aquabacterium humicola]|uniref:hypothetical protein n=1 Tax=Aquabacterium humicola TaxID=3237377 RepID=UPI0025437315|nr:hypothetical protein [Rubrivivax pictus]